MIYCTSFKASHYNEVSSSFEVIYKHHVTLVPNYSLGHEQIYADRRIDLTDSSKLEINNNL